MVQGLPSSWQGFLAVLEPESDSGELRRTCASDPFCPAQSQQEWPHSSCKLGSKDLCRN